MKKSTYKLEFKLFFGGHAAWIGIMILLITGFAGLYFGKTFIDNQRAVIEKAAVLQKKNINNNIEHFGKDNGLVFYHNKFSLANMPDQWAAFANGQRDINPYLISVTMLALEGQRYETDITNPLNLLFGNMDMSFVFIFLFPLVIIAFTYNLISEQQEIGIWALLKSQTNNLVNVIIQKFMVRLVTLYGTAVLLITAATIYLKLPLDFTFVTIIAFVFLYLLFWFAVSFFTTSLGRSSNFNASALVATWAMLCIVVPASVNLWLTQKFPMPEALQNVINQREGYHEKWDMKKEVTMEPFFRRYPELRKYPFPADKDFSWFWYYGMQQMGDEQASKSREAMERKLASRQHFTNVVGFFIPTIQTQLAVNELANVDLKSHLEFQEAVKKFHEQIRLHFYPTIFLEKDLETTNLRSIELYRFFPNKTFDWERILPILLSTALLFVLALLKLKHTARRFA